MKFGRINYFTLIAMSFTLLNSCKVLEPAPPAASFIHIDSIPVSSDYSTQGSNSSRVTDAWVLYNNAYLGTFPLPADFPVFGEGPHLIQVKAGVIENGISSIRSAYPKYDLYDTIVTLTVNQKTVITPSVTYLPGVVFSQLEDFDDASLSLIPANTNDAQLTITQTGDPDAFENNSGTVTLDANHPVFEVSSATPFSLPLDVPSYLEIDYKCENEFSIGIYITTSSGVVKSPLLTVKSSDEWKKLYVSLSDLGGVQPDALYYKIYLRAEKSSILNQAKLLFDNLKIVH